MKYVKQITGRFRNGKREEGLKIIAELWNENVGKVKGLTAFVLMANLYDNHGATNTTVWETKEDMDAYYNQDNKYQMILEQIKPMMEDELERREYIIFNTKMKESH
jgi:quinol monooxygenase YgiN